MIVKKAFKDRSYRVIVSPKVTRVFSPRVRLNLLNEAVAEKLIHLYNLIEALPDSLRI